MPYERVLPPLLLALAAAALAGTSLPLAALLVLAGIYLPEAALARAKGWRLSLLSLPALIVRDFLLPAIWLRAWLGGAIDWRGNTMTIGTAACELKEAAAGP